MPRGHSSTVRILATALLVLALSPVTAPFATFDLVSLLSDAAPVGPTMAKPKSATDPTVDQPVQAPGPLGPETRHRRASIGDPRPGVAAGCPLNRPLRI